VVSVPAREDLGKATATTPVNGYMVFQQFDDVSLMAA